MAACPDSSCHETVIGLKNCQDDIKKELPKKVSRVGFAVNVIAIFAILATFVVYALNAAAVTKKEQAYQAAIAKDERKENSKQVEVIKQTMAIEFTHIKEKLDEQITTGDIYRVVKQVMRENGNDKRSK